MSDRPFDDRPAFAECRITRRQAPDAMQMVRQQNPTVNGEGKCRSRFPDGFPKGGTNKFITEKRSPPIGHDRKEKCATRYMCPPIGRHSQQLFKVRIMYLQQFHLVHTMHPTPHRSHGRPCRVRSTHHCLLVIPSSPTWPAPGYQLPQRSDQPWSSACSTVWSRSYYPDQW